MTPEEFVKEFYIEKQSLVDTYFNSDTKTDVASLISKLNLNDEGIKILRLILNSALRDSLYTILLGLDGAASIGTKQTLYKIFDEENNELTGGEIENFAYEYFQNNKDD